MVSRQSEMVYLPIRGRDFRKNWKEWPDKIEKSDCKENGNVKTVKCYFLKDIHPLIFENSQRAAGGQVGS